MGNSKSRQTHLSRELIIKSILSQLGDCGDVACDTEAWEVMAALYGGMNSYLPNGEEVSLNLHEVDKFYINDLGRIILFRQKPR